MDLFDQVSSKLLLLTFTDVCFVTDPRVQSALDFLSHSDLLLESECLSLELGGLAGQFEQGLCNVNKILHLTGFFDAGLDGRLVVGAGLVQDTFDALIPAKIITIKYSFLKPTR